MKETVFSSGTNEWIEYSLGITTKQVHKRAVWYAHHYKMSCDHCDHCDQSYEFRYLKKGSRTR